MQMHYNACIILFCINDLLIVSIAKHRQNSTLNTQAGLYYVRNVVLVSLRVKISKILTRSILMLCKVIVGTVSNTPKLTPTEWEEELKVGSCL